MNRKNVYRWHRRFSIIIAFPVLIWAVSGFIHPIMSTIRPVIATQQPPQFVIDSGALKIPLDAALKSNNINEFYNCRLIRLKNQFFYQVKKNEDERPVYLSATNGNVLPNGDELYAIFLADHFASKVRLRVRSVNYIQGYTSDYNRINKLLPVYRVEFKRNDGICIYVDTQQSRFSYATNHTRSFLTRVFTFLHTWSWMDNLTLLKIVIITLLMLMVFLNGIIGLYIFFATRTKKSNGNEAMKHRRNHRYTAVFASLFTLLFSFSGGVHILSQLQNDESGKIINKQRISRSESNFDLTRILRSIHGPVQDISFIKMNGKVYLRTVVLGRNEDSGKDLMMQMHVNAPNVFFTDVSNYTILKNGEELYAGYLANIYLRQAVQPLKIAEITAFDDDYDFADKVLPVWRVTGNKGVIYVETPTSKLRKISGAFRKFDDYSFAFLHKHEFMMFAGKAAKDFSTMFWSAAQVVMIAFGLLLYFKRKKKPSRPK